LEGREIPSNFACASGYLSLRKTVPEALWPGVAAPPPVSAAFVPAGGDAEAERVLRAHQQAGPCHVSPFSTGGYRLKLPLGKSNPLVAAAVAARGAGLRMAEAVWREGPRGREVEGGLLQLVLRSGGPDGAVAGSPSWRGAPSRTAPMDGRGVPSSFARPSGVLFVPKQLPEALWPGAPAPLLFSAAFLPADGDVEAERVLRANQQHGPCRLGCDSNSGQFWLSLPRGKDRILQVLEPAPRKQGR
jgi:hypothetical protein